MAVLDSSSLIHILGGTPQGKVIQDRFADQAQAIAAVSVNEVMVGGRQEHSGRIRDFCMGFEILPFDAKAALKSAEIELALRKKGKPIGKLDIFIAATCIVHDLLLITTDKDFKNIDGLKVILV